MKDQILKILEDGKWHPFIKVIEVCWTSPMYFNDMGYFLKTLRLIGVEAGNLPEDNSIILRLRK